MRLLRTLKQVRAVNSKAHAAPCSTEQEDMGGMPCQYEVTDFPPLWGRSPRSSYDPIFEAAATANSFGSDEVLEENEFEDEAEWTG